jgi:cyclophilin family peptidyl-prolyl cis-trans isomerase
MPRVSFQTSMGEIVLELDREHAPATVDNFLRYAREGHYDGMVFYRVVPRFVIQAGSYDAKGNHRPTHDPIPLEANNKLSNTRGSVAMARQDEPNSATAEFFIDLSDLKGLDQAPDDSENKTGYAVFGHVVGGMDVVDAIAQVPLGGDGPFPAAAPTTPITIQKVTIIEGAAPPP